MAVLGRNYRSLRSEVRPGYFPGVHIFVPHSGQTPVVLPVRLYPHLWQSSGRPQYHTTMMPSPPSAECEMEMSRSLPISVAKSEAS